MASCLVWCFGRYFPAQHSIHCQKSDFHAIRIHGLSTTRIIIDCTEISIGVPNNMEHQSMRWSSYKSKNTFKAAVGVSVNGVVTLVSELYPGCVSDKAHTVDSSLLDKLVAGDTVMADKRFPHSWCDAQWRWAKHPAFPDREAVLRWRSQDDSKYCAGPHPCGLSNEVNKSLTFWTRLKHFFDPSPLPSFGCVLH